MGSRGLTDLRAGGSWWTVAPGGNLAPLGRQETGWLGTVLKIHHNLIRGAAK